MRKRWKLITATLVTAGLLGGCGFWLKGLSDSVTTKGETIVDVVETMRDPQSQFPGRNKISILLVGKDYNRNNKGIAYTKDSRADTIMLISLDLFSQKVSAISVPRDTKVRARDKILSKINGTMSRGGVELLKASVEDLTGVVPDYTVVIKPDAVREIVNAVGGVEVETIDEMHYDDNWGQLHIHLPAGKQRVDGEQAVGYTRFREVNTHRVDERGRRIPIKVVHSKEEGDGRRMARQQMLIRAIIAEAQSPGNLLGAKSIIDTAFGQIDTTLTRLQVMALGQIFRGAASDKIKTATLIGGEEQGEGYYYFVPDIEKTQALVDWMFFDNELSARKLVKVVVYNGTTTSGVAKRAADMLETQLFDAVSGGNTEKPAQTSRVVFRTAAVADRAKAIGDILGIGLIEKATPEEAKIEILGSVEPDVRVYIGADRATQLAAQKMANN